MKDITLYINENIENGKGRSVDLRNAIAEKVQKRFKLDTCEQKDSDYLEKCEIKDADIMALYGLMNGQSHPDAQTVWNYVQDIAEKCGKKYKLDAEVRYKKTRSDEKVNGIDSEYSEILFFAEKHDVALYVVNMRLVKQGKRFVELDLYVESKYIK